MVEWCFDGIVICGVKLYILVVSVLYELMMIFMKFMKLGEEDYVVVCMVLVNLLGVKIVDMIYFFCYEDKCYYLILGSYYCFEGFVIFDNVFVFNDCVFLDG